jgi:hypothetical protein
MRLEDWESRFGALIEQRMFDVHEFGRNDCALFGADVILALTGEDPGAPFRGAYDDAIGAASALRTLGAGTITRTFDMFLKRVPVALAKRGDLAMHDNNIGAVIGNEALFIGEAGNQPGLIRIGRANWSRAWAI